MIINYKKSGFTLIEMMIAMAILSMMSVLIYNSTSQTIQGKDQVEARDEQNHGATLFLVKLSNDVQSAFLLQQEFLAADGEMKTTFLGKEDELNFVAFANYRYIKNIQESDMAEVGYSIENDKEEAQKKILIRRLSAEVDDNNEKGGREEVMLENVIELKFEYYDATKKEWVKTWDSSQIENLNRLPKAVKVELKLQGSEEGEELLYQSVAEVKMYKGVLNY